MSARLYSPIVLAHGLFGFDRIAVGGVTFSVYFRGIPEALRASGNRVIATRVPPIAGVHRRARKLAERIEAAFPGEPVHLIGHSMGGLDARLLATDPAWSGRILSLTTIATPHLGSGLADFAKLRVGRIYSLLAKWNIDHQGFLDVTCRSAREFHRRVRVPTGIPCFSIAGDPAAETVCWPLRRLHAALSELEGPNDGLVSVESSIAFGTPLPSWPLDHFRQMNWLTPDPALADLPSPISLYHRLIEHLAELGFGTVETDDAADAAPRNSEWETPSGLLFPLSSRPWPFPWPLTRREGANSPPPGSRRQPTRFPAS